ncbi:hypothetical protein ACTHQ4_10225 [Alkalicoccobacillus gibsonii]|uniref:hypothetical protein n=1 Tax=Alkalicoccobacillus gibsonii TaxID=79881 RepID=UPI003F7CB40B
MSEKKTGYINKLHLIYLLIIAGVVLLSFISINHWSKEGASIALNNWATASSIVLAVVAIVMTIVDVAGQRNNILDLKETSEMLKENLNKIEDQVVEIEGIKGTLMDSMNQVFSSNEELKREFKEFAEKVNKGELTEEDKKKLSDEILDKLDKSKNITESVLKGNNKNAPSMFKNKNRIFQIKDFVKSYDSGNYSHSLIRSAMEVQNHRFSFALYKEALNELESEGLVKQYDGYFTLL